MVLQGAIFISSHFHVTVVLQGAIFISSHFHVGNQNNPVLGCFIRQKGHIVYLLAIDKSDSQNVFISLLLIIRQKNHSSLKHRQ